jgi:hypothetical protein
MSFLLSAKPRRRSQFTSSNVIVPRGKTSSNDAANIGGGGQVQIQRHQRSQPRQSTRIFPRQQGLIPQRDQQKQEAVQSAGISMEQGAWNMVASMVPKCGTTSFAIALIVQGSGLSSHKPTF